MQYILFEDDSTIDLRPLTLTRPVCDLRIGIDTLYEKWKRYVPYTPHKLVGDYRQLLYPNTAQVGGPTRWINGKVVPSMAVMEALVALKDDEGLLTEQGDLLAFRAEAPHLHTLGRHITRDDLPQVRFLVFDRPNVVVVRRCHDLFSLNNQVLRRDFVELTAGRTSEPITDPYVRVYNPEQIFIEPGATLADCTLNAKSGPIYIGAGADIQEGALIHGAHAICEHAVVNMGAKLRGDSTIGPYCKVGGEVSNSVFWGFSNKGHDGFVGNSVIGAWCNLGADTNTSNLKNNYGPVAAHSYRTRRAENTGLQFHGLVMGDHSKCGINTMWNTGTVVGVSANVWGGGFPPKFVPSFAWGGPNDAWETYRLEKAYETMERVMARRKMALSDGERQMYAHLFDHLALYE